MRLTIHIEDKNISYMPPSNIKNYVVNNAYYVNATRLTKLLLRSDIEGMKVLFNTHDEPSNTSLRQVSNSNIKFDHSYEVIDYIISSSKDECTIELLVLVLSKNDVVDKLIYVLDKTVISSAKLRNVII